MTSRVYELHVTGIPTPQGRPRFTIVGYGPRNIIKARDPERSLRWKQRVGYHALANRPTPIFTGPLKAHFRFVLPRPRRKKDESPHFGNKDVDNLAKAVLDGLSGVVYADDCQIVSLQATKEYGDPVGVWIRLEDYR